MARPKKLNIKETKKKKEELLLALEKNLGILSVSLKQVQTTRYYYDLWLNDDEFKASVDEIYNITIDFVESKLLKKVGEGDMTGIIFYLKCKGKDRGYIEKQYIEQNTTFVEPLRINVVVPPQIEGGDKKQIEK